MIDVGCGIGDFVAWFNDNSTPATGIEGTANVLPYAVTDKIIIHDLRMPLPWTPEPQPDLAMSIEVAEHIDESAADTFIHNLCSLADKILVSIAGPGQGGHGHVNLQPVEYWEALFQTYQFKRGVGIEAAIKAELHPFIGNRWVKTVHHNLFYFERGK